MAWFWLILGGLFEVGFTTALRFVDRFQEPVERVPPDDGPSSSPTIRLPASPPYGIPFHSH